jgi:two-component system sensor histidine kinase KdpD
VFDKFHRGAATTGGIGLGLTICRGIVTAHGGRIWAENRAGGGAAFRLSLPLDGPPPPMLAEAAAGTAHTEAPAPWTTQARSSS